MANLGAPFVALAAPRKVGHMGRTSYVWVNMGVILMLRFKGRVAIVTGAGSGIGEATAKRLAADGAQVVVADIDGQNAERVSQEIISNGGDAMAEVVDVSQEPMIVRMVESTVSRYGRIDMLHNNAAAVSSPEFAARDNLVVNQDVEVWDKMFAVNLRGVMLGCKHAIPHMIKLGGGSIVNTSSTSSLGGSSINAAYPASKRGVEMLTQTVAVQYGAQNIRCNAVLPGVTATKALKDNIPPPVLEMFRMSNCLPFIGEPADIANAVAFLFSDDARYITGQCINVCGGGGNVRVSFATVMACAEAMAKQQ
jgi:NAD(P)-dependent dehydrogenase (short-subunit alcohol dehydrogenase family)